MAPLVEIFWLRAWSSSNLGTRTSFELCLVRFCALRSNFGFLFNYNSLIQNLRCSSITTISTLDYMIFKRWSTGSCRLWRFCHSLPPSIIHKGCCESALRQQLLSKYLLLNSLLLLFKNHCVQAPNIVRK